MNPRNLQVIVSMMILSLCFIAKTSAQTSIEENNIVRSSLDAMFEDLDKTKVPTGLLLDYAVDLVDLNYFDGSELTDTNYVDRQIFEDIVRSVKSGYVGSGSFININAVMESFDTPLVANDLNVGIAFYKYNYIKANAMTDGLITFDSSTEKVSDVYQNGIWQNPYDDAFVFAFTPSSNICLSGSARFKFSTDFLFMNHNISRVYFDAGDGGGYRMINPGSSVIVNYFSTGQKELKLRLMSTLGQVFESHSYIYVVENAEDIPTKGDGNSYEPTDSIIRSVVTSGPTVSGQMTYYSASNDGKIRKPFIVVEGFDPMEITHLLIDTDISLGCTNHRRFAKNFYKDSVLDNDYDLVYIDFFNSTEDIRANADLLKVFLSEINTLKSEAGSTHKNVVLGQSMGGLVARYALKTMENDNELHDVATYISHDSPHLGANVPLGALYFIHQAICMSLGKVTTIALYDLLSDENIIHDGLSLYRILHSKAAKQMLVNYVNPIGILDNSIHNEWQTELNQLGFPEGDFGEGIENLTIVNGCEFDFYNTLANNNHIFYLNGYAKTKFWVDFGAPILSLLLGFLPQHLLNLFNYPNLSHATFFWGTSKFNFHAEINPLSSANNGKKISELSVSYTKTYLWLIPVTYTLFSSKKYAPNNTFYYDEYPGSVFYILPQQNPIYQTTPIDIPYVGYFQYTIGVANKIMFIPTASALAISGDVTSADFATDYFNNRPIPIQETYFDSYYLNNDPDYYGHITISSRMFSWIKNQLSLEISGPESLIGEATYSVPGYYGNLTWSTSDSSVATIDASGKLTAIKGGKVTVTAESYVDGKLFRKRKDVMVSFPDIVIKYSYVVDKGYEFRAESTDDNATTMLNRLVSEGVFQYEWNLIDSSGELTTQTSSSCTFSYLPQKGEVATIAVRLVYADGEKGPLKSVSVNLRVPFNVNYSYVVVTEADDIYFIKTNGTYDAGSPAESFAVTYKYTAYDQNDNPLSGNLMYNKYIKGENCYLAYPGNMGFESYLTGTKSSLLGVDKWTFTFFDAQLFLEHLTSALYFTSGTESVFYEFDLTICNALKEKMQKIPFVIIYKPVFPEN